MADRVNHLQVVNAKAEKLREPSCDLWAFGCIAFELYAGCDCTQNFSH